MKILRILTAVLTLMAVIAAQAQDEWPTVRPEARFDTPDGEIEDASSPQSAPLTGHFTSNVENLGNYSVRYEWRIYPQGQESAPLIQRYDVDMDYTFTQSGTFCVQLYATFIHGTDTIQYPGEGEAEPFVVSISESKLELPNAFTPNGDGINDVYRVKDNYQSIVSFRAAIFNRWGQKLYTWTDITGGWDGTYHGSRVKDGTYFVVVEARGADGREYKIKKDVNILTGFERNDSNGSNL
ncbi:MAG: gliding motility-associated C-terminal domain-containing protein [Clostridium sp.]|nr:gliding motility-associated C-terminal domain-containing protein [Clostridium sp.]